MSGTSGWTARTGLYFVLLFGAVNLFADFAYEGARSVGGPFLAALGASGLVAGLVGGFGEFIGYALRLVSGRWADRSGRYWLITLLGYLVQMIAVPMLALAGSWQAAAALMVAERMGKAIRNPPRDVMLSEAGEVIGRGWAFGVNEALDQLGAFAGPLVVASVYARAGRRQGTRLSNSILVVRGGLGAGGIWFCRLFADRLSFRQERRDAGGGSSGGLCLRHAGRWGGVAVVRQAL